MTTRLAPGLAGLCLGGMLLSGCSALGSLQSAATPLETYELTPLAAPAAQRATGRRVLEIALPTATGALTSERIAIKPGPLQVQALPEARWVDEATDHVQLLLVRSLANAGAFGLVTAAGAGPTPDYVLLSDLQAFQAELGAGGVNVVIQTTLSLIDARDGRVVSTRSFAASQPAADTTADAIVPAFDAAMTRQLTEIAAWIAATPAP